MCVRSVRISYGECFLWWYMFKEEGVCVLANVCVHSACVNSKCECTDVRCKVSV
jgi:hypothetical protein